MDLQVLILLATNLAISYGQYEEIVNVFVESGSEAVLPYEVFSADAHSYAVQWKRIIGGEVKTVWRRDRNGLEYRPTGTSLRAYCPQPNFGRGLFSLHLKDVRKEDAGVYLCVVEGKRTQKFMLRVIQVSFTPAEVVEGELLKVTCSINPRSNSLQTKWELNGSPATIEFGSQLAFNSVSQNESGIWSCLVLQNNKASGKASASLQVKGILTPKDNRAVVYAEVGSSTTLPCIFSDGLIVNKVSWKKTVTASGIPVLPLALTSKNPYDLHIRSVEEKDKGTYECFGQIEMTSWKKLAMRRNMLLVTAQVLSSSRGDQLSLTCELSNSSRVTYYEWLRLDYGENDTQTLSTVQNSTSKILKIPKGEDKHLGGWVCRFYEHQTLLGNASYHQSMMSALEGKNESGSGRKVFTIIGLSMVALMLLLVLLKMYKNHRRRKMIMQYPAMETIVHLAANERERIERNNRREKECSVNLKSVSV